MEKEIENYNPEVELLKPIPEDKFDKHMQAARKNHIQARREVFENQYETNGNRSERYAKIKSSIY